MRKCGLGTSPILPLFILASLLALTGCVTPPAPRLHRAELPIGTLESSHPNSGESIDQNRPVENHPAADTPASSLQSQTPVAPPAPSSTVRAADRPAPHLRFVGESATFSFSDESVQTVAKAILGELLHLPYTIAPGVQGSITLISQTPIPPAAALRLLDRALASNNLRMVYVDGGFSIVPADQSLISGLVAPAPRESGPGAGFESRIVPLHWIGAGEAENLLKPFARPNAIIAVDSTRNQITLAGSQEELANYLRIIDTFDVDWMQSMSIASIPVATGRASKLAADLETLFGSQGRLPIAGAVRFIPLDSTGTLIVISPNPQMLDRLLSWVDRIDGTDEAPHIYSYDLRYANAKDIASHVAELVEQASLPSQTNGIRISALEETNSILVRASPSNWKSLREAIRRIDVMPLQVHIETQVVEVAINDTLRHGVSWYFNNAVTDPTSAGGAGLPPLTSANWHAVRGSIEPAERGVGWVFRNHDAAAVVSALDAVSDVRILQTPSLWVKNNTEASLNSGSRIPVTTVRIDTGGSEPYGQVQYLDTGLSLRVKPRVTREGNVFLQIDQELSTPGSTSSADVNGNVRIDTNKLSTQVTLNAGDTIMLAGMMRQSSGHVSSGAPALSRMPVLGGLFGQQRRDSARDELVILVTASVASDFSELRRLTDEYLERFQSLRPFRNSR